MGNTKETELSTLAWVGIGIAIIVIVVLCIFLLIYLTSKSNKKKMNNASSAFYQEIIKCMGGKANISDVYSVSSRLNIVLKDSSLVTDEALAVLKEKGIGVIKSSKKMTLVVGEFAASYEKSILKEINN